MTENTQRIREAVCKAIAITLRRSGRNLPDFKDTDEPLKDYDGFDSHCGLEVTVELEVALRTIDLGNNVFIEGAGNSARARNVSEIVANIVAKMKARKE
jgi:hypothetical protein